MPINDLKFTISADAANAKKEVNDLKAALANNFGDISKVSEGALRGLNNQVAQLARQVPLVGQPLAGVTRQLLNLTSAKKEVDDLSGAFKRFQTVLGQVAAGGNKPALGELKNLGIDVDAALRSPQQAFQTFITGLKGMETQAGQTATAVNVLGANVGAQLLPQLTATGGAAQGASAGLASMLGPIGLAVAAAAVLTVGLAGLALEGARLAQNSAKFGDEIYRAGLRTKLTAEELSALRLAAAENTASFDTVVNGLSRYLRNLDEAALGNKKLREEFKSLGIDVDTAVKTPQAAINEFIAAFERLGPTAEENQTAIRLLGKSGDQLIPTLKSLGGNVTDAVGRAREFNAVVGDDAARASHSLVVQLVDVQAQVEGLKRDIGAGFQPVVRDALDEFSKLLRDNKGDLLILAYGFAQFTHDVVGNLRSIADAADVAQGHVAEVFARRFGGYFTDVDPGRVPAPGGITGPSPVPLPSGLEEAKRAAVDAEDIAKATKVRVQEQVESIRGLYEQHQISVRQFTEKRIAYANQERDAVLASIRAQREAILKEDAETAEERLKQRKELLALETAEWQADADFRKAATEGQKLEFQEREKAREKERREQERQSDILKRISQDYAVASTRVSGYTANSLHLEAALYKLSIGFNTLSDANKELAQQEVNRLFSAKLTEEHLKSATDLRKTLTDYIDKFQIPAQEAEATEVGKVTAALAKFVDAGGEADETLRKLTVQALAYAQRMDDARAATRRFTEGLKLPQPEAAPLALPSIGGAGSDRLDIPSGFPGLSKKEIEGLGSAPVPKFDTHKQIINDFKDFAVGAFDQIGGSFEGMISAFLAGGDATNQSFGAMAKAVIRSLAAQALVESFMETARGIAELAKAAANPATAAQHLAAAHLHFASAIAFGAIGGVAAGISLATRGGSANQAFSGGSGSGAGNSTADNQPKNQNFRYGSDYVDPSSAAARGEQGTVFQKVAAYIDEQRALNAQQSRFNAAVVQHVTSQRAVPPGYVVATGASDARGELSAAVLEHSGENYDFVRTILEHGGFAR